MIKKNNITARIAFEFFFAGVIFTGLVILIKRHVDYQDNDIAILVIAFVVSIATVSVTSSLFPEKNYQKGDILDDNIE